MQSHLLHTGRTYTHRANPADPASHLSKVQVIAPPRSRQVKIRHADGELNGLEEWVPTRQIMCPWGERRAYLRDERREAELRAASEHDREAVEEQAISTVFEATGDETGFIRSWTVDPARGQRLWSRAGLGGTPADEPLAYRDRHGALHLSYATALKFAQAFAATEPEPCLMYLREWEDRLRAEGFEPGNRSAHHVLRQMAPAHALVRGWCELPAYALWEDEAKRLRTLLARSIARLSELGDEETAQRLTRAMKGG